MRVPREWAGRRLLAYSNFMVPFLFDGATCRADHGHPALHQARASRPSDLPAQEGEAYRTRTVQSSSPVKTGQVCLTEERLVTLGLGLWHEGCH